MHAIRITGAAYAFLLIVGCGGPEPIASGTPVPSLTAPKWLNGTQAEVDSYEGNVVVIDVFATW